MTTLRKHFDLVKAEMDKSLLEAAGIQAFIAGENSASIGYGGIIAEIHLQVQDADVDRARQVLQDNKEATPLSDDFIPPAALSSEKSELEIADPDSNRAVLSVIVTSLVVFAIFVAFGSWKNSHSATAYYRSGYIKWTKGILDGAIADYDGAIQLNPKYMQAYYHRGIIRREKNDLNGALVDFDKAIELDPKYTHAYVYRGSVKRASSDFDGALADFDRAIELDPKQANAYDNRGFTKTIKGDLDGGLADYEQAILLEPKDASPYYGRGVIHYDKHDWKDALADLHEASVLESPYSGSNRLHDYSHIRIWMVRAKLSERVAATSELRQYFALGQRGNWPTTISRFLTGDLSENAFFKAATSDDKEQTRNETYEAYFYAGTMRLINGDKSVASEYFKKCLEIGLKNRYEYESTAAELEALKQ
jgi:lipoprotein NlpI